MAEGEIRIKQFEEITSLTDNDYVATDNSATGGETKKYKLKRLSDAITELAETTEEAIEDVVEETDDKFAEALAEGTAQGAIASFTDGSTLPMKKLEVDIEPVQDLHGYDNPWVGGSGKNKLPLNVSNIKANNTNGTWSENAYTESGVTFTLLTDNGGNITGIKTNGTASANIYFVLSEGELNWITFDGSYIINGCSNGSSTTYAIQVYSNESSSVRIDNFNQDNYIQSSSSTYTIKNVMIVIRNGYTASNLMFYPMIRLRSVTDATFEPYSNICPISGWDEANVSVVGKNLASINSATAGSGNVYVYSGKAIKHNITISFKCNNFSFTNGGASLFIIIDNDGRTHPITPAGFGLNANTVYNNRVSGTYNINYEFKEIFIPTTGYTSMSGSLDDIQIELSATATDYEPYNGQNYTIDLDGTRYGGKLDVVSGVLTVDRGYKLFDGSDNTGWRFSGNYGISSRFDCQTIVGKPSGNVISNAFAKGTVGNDKECISLHGSGGYFILEIHTDRLATNDVTGLMSYFTSNPLQLVYELATPQTIQLTPTEVKSLLATNNVFADTGDILDATYVRNANITINELIQRIENLEG